MKVICIHVYGVSTREVPITVEVGGIYRVIRTGKFKNGTPYYEFAHQPGVGYDQKCFVPLDPEDEETVEIQKTIQNLIDERRTKKSPPQPIRWNVLAILRRAIQAIRG
jgi:hypothetical protein